MPQTVSVDSTVTASPENVQKHRMLSGIGLSWKAAGAVGAVGTASYSFVRHRREQRSAEFLDTYWWKSAALIVADNDGRNYLTKTVAENNRDRNPPFAGTRDFNSPFDELHGRDAYSCT